MHCFFTTKRMKCLNKLFQQIFLKRQYTILLPVPTKFVPACTLVALKQNFHCPEGKNGFDPAKGGEGTCHPDGRN